MKNSKFGKTRKDTRWKRGELVVVEIVRKQSESEDGGMRELRDICEVVIIWEYFRREGCEKTEVNGNERKKGEREK